jgi:hypothetical protein
MLRCLICVYAIMEVSVGCIFMLGRMVGSVPGNGVSEGGFSAREYLYILFSFVYRVCRVV